MKMIIFTAAFILLFIASFGQAQSKPAKKPCKPPIVYHYSQGNSTFESVEEIKPHPPSREAKTLLNNLLKIVSLDLNNETGVHLFSTSDMKVKSTVSFVEENQPYIVYNQSFFDRFYSSNSENWQLKFVFAHELGHHLNGHTSINAATFHREKAADKFAGWLLGLLGAKESEVLEWMSSVEAWTVPPHPPREDRIASAKEGLISAQQLMKTYVGTIPNDVFSGSFTSRQETLSISASNRFDYKIVTFQQLDINKDFRIEMKVKSRRIGGSTRFGLGWNFHSASNFQLFTLHNENQDLNSSSFTIGRGNCNSCGESSWVRYKSGNLNLNGNQFNTLALNKKGNSLSFYINDSKVWASNSYQITTNQFAFWVADFSVADFEYIRVFQ